MQREDECLIGRCGGWRRGLRTDEESVPGLTMPRLGEILRRSQDDTASRVLLHVFIAQHAWGLAAESCIKHIVIRKKSIFSHN
jgi:hypothetical protein